MLERGWSATGTIESKILQDEHEEKMSIFEDISPREI